MYKRGQFNETIAIFGQAWLVQAASRGMRRKFISFTLSPTYPIPSATGLVLSVVAAMHHPSVNKAIPSSPV